MSWPFVIGLGIGTCIAVALMSFVLAAVGLTWRDMFPRRV